jgi:hypothetical protein
MAGLAGLMAAATRLATAAGGVRYRARAQIAELGNLPGDFLASLFEIGKRKGHVVTLLILAYQIRKEYGPKKRTLRPLTSVSHTLPARVCDIEMETTRPGGGPPSNLRTAR